MNGPGYRLVLTGASGGLGRAFALALAPHASAMVLVGRDRARLESLQEHIAESAPGTVVRTVTGDLTEASVRLQVFDAARALPAQLNLLINAAGINEFHAFESQASASIERLLAVNLLVPIQLTQLLLPLLRISPRAQVINVGSIFGYLGYPGFAVYCATKFGLRGFSQALRRELSDSHIAVRYFAPRATRTALTTPAIAAMNRELNTAEDTPERVAEKLLQFISRGGGERKLGFPERLYVLFNHLMPGINDRAIRGQLAVIRRHFNGAGAPSALTPKEDT
ncbi:MAG TPA: SDR family oxidoreductase [Burkholderiales bacterium]|nr:SDR family oxidoreductase [Burkholderiales bacterium]